MGCVSSNLLNHDDKFTQIGSTGLGHHIVSLTSTTYGLLTLDPPSNSDNHHRHTSTTTLPSTPPPRFTLGSIFLTPLSETRSIRSEPEVINFSELMAGLDTDSFRFYPLPPPPSSFPKSFITTKPNITTDELSILKPVHDAVAKQSAIKYSLEKFEKLCPPNGENRVVVYTTTLRGVRKTYEACNAARAAIEGMGVVLCERDVSMDRGFREELRELMKGKEGDVMVPPQVFVKGRYVGGVEDLLRIHDEGCLGEMLHGLPKREVGAVCEGCGGVRFLPCFSCNGSCKMVIVVKEEVNQKQGRTVVFRCADCNENGLVLCPICS